MAYSDEYGNIWEDDGTLAVVFDNSTGASSMDLTADLTKANSQGQYGSNLESDYNSGLSAVNNTVGSVVMDNTDSVNSQPGGFWESLSNAFGNAVNSVVNAAGNAAGNAINKAGNSASNAINNAGQKTTTTTQPGATNQQIVMFLALGIAVVAALYLASKRSS